MLIMSGKMPMLSKRNSNSRYIVSILLLCLSVVLVGCKKDPRVVFIQGVWYYKDAHLANIPSESAQVTTWVFENGYVSMDSCCFVKMNFSGYYSVTDRSENELTLELFNLQGQAGDTVLYRDDTLNAIIKINPEADTILINHDGPYTRNSP
jgi:hypothetical protein